MQITLYKTPSTSNTIGKTLESETPIANVLLKDKTDIKNPVLKLKSDDSIFGFNYCYIPNFKRFYFINNIRVFPNSIYELDLSVDVLETFKADILKSKGFVNRQTEFNSYYNRDYTSEVRKEIDIYKSETTLKIDSKNMVLVTVGG